MKPQTMTKPEKFCFDRDFEIDPNEVAFRRRLSAEHAGRLDSAAHDAHARGVAEGMALSAAERDARIADSLATIAARLETLSACLAETLGRVRSESAALAVAAAQRLAGELIQREPMAEIEALFAECLAHVDCAPRFTIGVHGDLAEAVEQRLSTHAAIKGFAGSLSFVPLPGLTPGDCRVEWADGGVSRDFGRIAGEIERAVRRHMQPANSNTAPGGPSCNGAER